MIDSFNTKTSLQISDNTFRYFSLDELSKRHPAATRLPRSLKVLLENLLRHEDGVSVTRQDIETLANWDATAEPSREVAFVPARTVLQDFTGVPCVVDLAAMRDAMKALGADPKKINPLSPAELVIDHSVMVDYFGSADAFDLNAKIEFERNRERYAFLRWGQEALSNFRVVPPDTGIVHQVNLEYLARVVMEKDGVVYPDTVVGTDSHTTMINGVGVLGWGVGGIEAEAAMLGQPISMLTPQVVGFRLTGKLPEGATATDLVLTVTEMLRKHGVVGKFVEFYGEGLKGLALADRATIANMAPEYGATCGYFPISAETLSYLRLTGRSPDQVELVEAYAKAQGLWDDGSGHEAEYSSRLHLDLASVKPSLAGPKRPQDRVLLGDMKSTYQREGAKFASERGNRGGGAELGASAPVGDGEHSYELKDGAVVIAAITSCTNTSNPAVLIAAGLLARNARIRGLKVKPWVKTSLAPGSKVVTDYLKKAGLADDLDALGYNLVGYGCTTCIGNSGPLPEVVSQGIGSKDLIVASVLSGNRNFEGRVHPEVRMNFLASPPLVVAYALAGSVDLNLERDPIGADKDGRPVLLKEIWPSTHEVQETIARAISADMFRTSYGNVFAGDPRWQALTVPEGDAYQWDDRSTYVRNPPYFVDMPEQAPGILAIAGARCLALLGDSITTDHISPAGSIKKDSPAGKYLIQHGVQPADFNSYGSRRGNHEVMMRGTFANIRIRNQLVPGVEGGYTKYLPDGRQMSIYDAAMKYQAGGMPLIIVAGKEYGTGSSRDWAAKGTLLLGVKAVLAESFERIHRSNLVGMGVLPICFTNGENARSLGLDGTEIFDIEGLKRDAGEVTVKADKNGDCKRFTARVRIDTPKEWDYYEHGGILQYVLRELAAA